MLQNRNSADGITVQFEIPRNVLPGTYSLSPQSMDEQISRDVLLNRLPELPAPSLIVVVVEIGLISPPVGMNLFVLNTLLPQVPTRVIFKVSGKVAASSDL